MRYDGIRSEKKGHNIWGEAEFKIEMVGMTAKPTLGR
jgi:hypothetical protein